MKITKLCLVHTVAAAFVLASCGNPEDQSAVEGDMNSTQKAASDVVDAVAEAADEAAATSE